MEDIRITVALVGLAGAVAGALLTALVSLFTGYLSRKHEEHRWLLDKRLEAYLAYEEAVSSAVEMLDRQSKFSLIDIATQMQTVLEEWHRMRLLAPLATGDKARDVVDQLNKILDNIANEEQHAPDREAMLRKRLELRQRERRDIQGRWYYRS